MIAKQLTLGTVKRKLVSKDSSQLITKSHRPESFNSWQPGGHYAQRCWDHRFLLLGSKTRDTGYWWLYTGWVLGHLIRMAWYQVGEFGKSMSFLHILFFYWLKLMKCDPHVEMEHWDTSSLTMCYHVLSQLLNSSGFDDRGRKLFVSDHLGKIHVGDLNRPWRPSLWW